MTLEEEAKKVFNEIDFSYNGTYWARYFMAREEGKSVEDAHQIGLAFAEQRRKEHEK